MPCDVAKFLRLNLLEMCASRLTHAYCTRTQGKYGEFSFKILWNSQNRVNDNVTNFSVRYPLSILKNFFLKFTCICCTRAQIIS